MTSPALNPAERRCTWCFKEIRCARTAKHEQVDKAGNVWADLCDEHSTELDAAVASVDPKRNLSAWIKASGGSKKLSERMSKAAAPMIGKILGSITRKAEK